MTFLNSEIYFNSTFRVWLAQQIMTVTRKPSVWQWWMPGNLVPLWLLVSHQVQVSHQERLWCRIISTFLKHEIFLMCHCHVQCSYFRNLLHVLCYQFEFLYVKCVIWKQLSENSRVEVNKLYSFNAYFFIILQQTK